MPVEVTKNVVSADCARAGCAAIKVAARQHTDEIILANVDIDSSELLFAICFCDWFLISPIVEAWAWSDINTPGSTLFRFRNAAMKRLKIKRRRGTNRSAFYRDRVAKGSGLLDRRQFPAGAARPQEGPHFRNLGRLIAAVDNPTGGTIEGLVDQREPHRHAGKVGLAFPPGFREIALQQLDGGGLVDLTAGPVLVKIASEIRHHFGRGQCAQFADILVRPRRLNLAEQPLEGFVVAGRKLKRRAARSQAETRSRAEARWRAGARTSTGIGGLMAALPPRHRQPNHDDDQPDLQDQAEDRRESAKTTEHSAAEQHAEQTGAKEARGQTAKQAHAGPVEEPAARGRAQARAARLGEGAVERLCGTRRRRSARRRGKRSRSPGTRTDASADSGIGR